MPAAAHALTTFLKHTEEFGLGLQGQFTDLVQKECAAIGQFKATHAPCEIPPVKAPLSWPNSSLSTSPAGIAVQFTLISGLADRWLFEWIARAISSFPVPVSPPI